MHPGQCSNLKRCCIFGKVAFLEGGNLIMALRLPRGYFKSSNGTRAFSHIESWIEMSYELVYEGKIESAERTETGNWRVHVHLKSWCIDCRKATYECAHLSPKSGGIMYFALNKKPEAGYLRYYAERQPTPSGTPFKVEIT